MSPLPPASAFIPDSKLSPRSRVSASTPRSRSRKTSAPGSTEPERVAIGTPSSGLKPIVVSTERPFRTAVTEQPPPRWHATIRAASSCDTTHCTAIPWNPYRRTPQSRQRSGIAYVDAASGIVEWNAVSKTATCGTPGSAARASRIAPSAGVLCSGAIRESSSIAASTSSSITTGSVYRAPPWTTRCPTASAGTNPSTGRDSSPSTRDSFKLVEPALTVRTERNASVLPDPVADRRLVVAVVTRPQPAAEALVDHLLPQPRRLRGQPRYAVDDVDHVMEAVEVIEHDHVERRRRRALFLVAAHVEVPV